MTRRARDWTLHPGVRLGRRCTVGPYCVLGEPPRDAGDGDLPTIIGADAVIRSHTVVYAGNRIGRRLQTGHRVMIRESNEIGDDVSIGTGTVIEHHVTIGRGVRIHSNAFIPEFSVLEEGCWIGPNVVFTNAKYPLSPRAKTELRGPVVEKGAKVGANSTLLPGVRIGAGALVGAGSVVVKDVAPGTVVAGNPARRLKDVRDLPYA